MKTTAKQTEISQTISPKANKQTSINNVLQAYKDKTAQCQSAEEEELLQGKFEIVQRMESEEEKPVQVKSVHSSTIQQQSEAIVQRVSIDGIDVIKSGSMPQWVQGERTYHLNLTTDPLHITCENWPDKKGTTKMHFFFKREGDNIKNAVSGQKGKKKFSDLPQSVQTFVSNNYIALLNVI